MTVAVSESPGMFKSVNQAVVIMWRLGLGKAINISPNRLGRIMVLSTIGRKSGLVRRTPLNYSPGIEHVYCIAGYGEQSAWVKNIKANPRVELWLPEGRFLGEAMQVGEPQERLRIIRRVMESSGFAAKTFGGVNMETADDATLAEATKEYLAFRIDFIERLPSRPGPGDLAWIWGVAGLGLCAGLALKAFASRKE